MQTPPQDISSLKKKKDILNMSFDLFWNGLRRLKQLKQVGENNI